MKIFRKIIGIFTAAALFCCSTASVFATDNTVVESKETVGAYTYGLNGHYQDTYTYHGKCYSDGEHYSVISYDFEKGVNPPAILEQLHGIPVTCIRAAFRKPNYAQAINTSPVIPPYVTDISYGFSQATFATAPEIPDGVKNISCAFEACVYLTSFPKLPSELAEMSMAFAGCSNLTGSVEIPSTVTDIEAAFKDCTRLGAIPDISKLKNLTVLEQAFSTCKNAVGGTDLPNSGIDSIRYLFNECSKMTTPPSVIYDSVTDIANAFYNCSSLTGTIDLRATLSLDKPADYLNAFKGASHVAGAELILNYTAQNEAVIDDIIAKKTIINNIKKGVLLPAVLPPEGGDGSDGDGEDGDSSGGTPPEIPPVTPPENSLPIVDGKGNQDVIIQGIVEPINTLDVDVPLNLQFIIDENRDIHYTKNAKVISRSPAPLTVSSKSVTLPQGAPKLVADDAFSDWNNLTIAQTRANIAISINGKNLSTAGIKLGDISSGYGTEASLPLNLSVLYGKQWNNTSQLIFDYSMNLELALAN